jgi:non-homologous end joining protein Ku
VAPPAYWKGYLRLSLVSCPIQLFPATSEREKISFHQLLRARPQSLPVVTELSTAQMNLR